MQVQNLQISPTGIKPVINVSQNDVGRQFQLVLYDGTTAYNLPSGTTARIDGIKPDRKGFSYSDAVTVSGNVVTVTTKQQMTIVAGTVECEIRFSNGGNDIGTLNFKMMVEPSPINEDTDISETDLPAVIEQGRQNMLNSEAWAKGTKNGVAVGSSEPQYHNNSKYHSEQAASSASTASTAATNAANSASTASTKASEASASATNAANSAATAAAWSAHPPYIGANGNWYVWNTNTSAYVDSGVDASITVQIADVTMLATTATPYVTNTGTNTDPIFHLFVPKGAGIASIEKTGTSGLVDTYTITFTDGQTTTFDVTNGAAGRGIASITKTGTAGLVDTYTITYTDGTTSTYDVTNGQDGTGATLQTLADVNITNLTDGDILAYNSTSRKFENEALAAVARTGSYSDLSNKPTLGTAAAKDSTNAITQSSTDLIESGAVYTETQSIRQALTTVKGGIANLSVTGTINNTGSTIVSGKYFFLNDVLVRAKVDIASGATFTSSNYETVVVGNEKLSRSGDSMLGRLNMGANPISFHVGGLVGYNIVNIGGILYFRNHDNVIKGNINNNGVATFNDFFFSSDNGRYPSQYVSDVINTKQDAITFDFSHDITTQTLTVATEYDIDFSSLIPSGKTLLGAVVRGYTVGSDWETELRIRYVNVDTKKVRVRPMGATNQTYTLALGVWYK